MKTIAVWTLMAVAMIASQPSYAYGDALFHVLLKGAMEDKAMVSASPKAIKTDEPTSLSAGGAAVGFGVSTVAPVLPAMPCTDTNTVAVTDPALLDDPEFINTLDHTCGTPAVRLETTER